MRSLNIFNPNNILSTFKLLWYPLTIVTIYLGAILLIAEILNRIFKIDPELTRKIVHIGSGNVILLAWWLHIPTWIIISASAFASAIAILSYFLPILPSVNSVGRKSLGTFFYAISIGILASIFWQRQPQYVAIGILIMAWGDGLAALIGQKFGKHPYKIWGNSKSWEGSIAMAITSFIVVITILIGTQSDLIFSCVIALTVAIVVASLETISQLGIDNLIVPIGGASLCFFLQQLFALL